MLKNIRIGIKLPLTIIALCVVAVGSVGYLSYKAAHKILEEEGRTRLQSVLESQASALTAQLESLRNSVVSQSISPVARSALTTFIGAFEALPGNKTETLQNRYIAENENPAGQRQLLDFAPGRDAYNRGHRNIHPFFRSIAETNRYADLYLLDDKGNVLYSVMKNADFATDLRDAARPEDGFRRAYERVMAGGEQDAFVYEDFADYELDQTTFSAFLAAPVRASNGAVLGVFVARIESGALKTREGHNKALGETGYTHVVGIDGRMRGQAPSGTTGGAHHMQIGDGTPLERALAGEEGMITSDGMAAGSVLAAFMPIEFEGTRWAIVAQQDTDELFADAVELKRSMLIEGGGLMLAAAVIAIFLARTIIAPLTSVGTAMNRVSRGDYDADIPEITRGDEVGAIAQTLDSFRASLLEARAIEERVALLGTALEATTACLMLVDNDLTVNHVNEAAIALLNRHLGDAEFDARRVEGRNLADFFAGSAQVAAAINAGPDGETAIDIRLGDARVTLELQPVRCSEGGCRGVVIEWKDKTQEFRQSALIGSIDQQQCLIEFDLDGRVTSTNANFESLFGQAGEEIVGTPIDQLITIDPAKLNQTEGFLAEIFAEKSVWGAFHVSTHGGADIWLDGAVSVVADGNGEPLSIVLIGNDISENRAAIEVADEERRAVAEAQRLVVAELGAGLSRLSDGDLTVQIAAPFQGEYEVLRADFNSAVASLLRAMRKLVVGADKIRDGATGVSVSADDLLKRTNSQADTLAGTASEISQLAGSVASAAERAQSTSQIVVDTRENAIASGGIVEDAIAAMGEIEQSSQTISNITGVIEDIAFQTNLLALNAGVEAARAGDAGRGFAVVASEVRALAQRSSEAASEINRVISEANQQIDRGVKLVDGAGKALGEIFESVKGIAGNVEEIAKSSASQSDSLREIDQAVGELDQVTRRNAEMLSETTQAGHSLKKEADALSEANAQFNVGSASEVDPGKTGAAKTALPAPAAAKVARDSNPPKAPATDRARPGAVGVVYSDARGGADDDAIWGTVEDWDADVRRA